MADAPPAFQCTLADRSIRIFGLAFAYLAKCGRDVTMEIGPTGVSAAAGGLRVGRR
jgi:hypothetical protein